MKRRETQKLFRRMAPDVRREAILDAAQALFMQQGYEAVTVADVLAAAGISKGGFYHHFTAKEDLLTGVIMRMTEEGLAVAEGARNRADGDALTRLNAFFAASLRWKADNIDGMRAFAAILLQRGNDILFQRAFTETAKAVTPVLADMIADGEREGLFDVADPGLAAEIIVGLSQGRQAILIEAIALASKGDLEAATDRLDARMRAEGATCDRLLGLPQGSVALTGREVYRRMLAGLAIGDPDTARASASGRSTFNPEADRPC